MLNTFLKYTEGLSTKLESELLVYWITFNPMDMLGRLSYKGFYIDS